MSKQCSLCREIRPLASFGPRPERPSGRRPACLDCERIRSAKYKADNAEKVRAATAKARSESPERFREAQARYRKKHPEAAEKANISRRLRAEQVRARARELYAANRAHILTRKARCRQRNPEKARAREIAYIESLPPEVMKARWKADNRKRLSTPQGRLANAIRVGIVREMTSRGKNGRTFDLLGFTVDDLRAHLERLFLPGMTWENYGRGGWHIDHVIPLSAFNYQTAQDHDFRRAWSLANLQPLWEKDNLSKGARLAAPFQPSLAI